MLINHLESKNLNHKAITTHTYQKAKIKYMYNNFKFGESIEPLEFSYTTEGTINWKNASNID